MAKYLKLERLGQSAIVTINNAPANLWTVDGLNEFTQLIKDLEADSGIRALVLTGAGDSYFSAGADVNQLAGGGVTTAEKVLDAFNTAFAALRNYRGVTVAAVNGYALGGGLECALSCDYLVVERGAQLGMPEAQLGLLPFAGGTKMLADKVGVAWAKRLILGGEVISADKAYEIGLAEEIVDQGLAKIVAVSLANKVAAQAPGVVALARKLIEAAPNQSLDQHLVQLRHVALSLAGQAEQQEGISAFLGKRSPKWVDED